MIIHKILIVILFYFFTSCSTISSYKNIETIDSYEKEEMHKQKVEVMYCPHCGTKGTLQIKEKFFNNI